MKIIERIVESEGSPSQSNDLWLQPQGENVSLKYFHNGKWTTITGGDAHAVSSDDVETIVSLTQTEFDNIQDKDEKTLYIIPDTGKLALGSNMISGTDGVGIQSIVQTTISTTDGGTNVWTATLTNGQTFNLEVRNGNQGNSGYSGAAGELEVVNNLTDGGATAALSAEMGKELGEDVSQLRSELTMFDQLTKTQWAGAIAEIYIYPDYANTAAEYRATSSSTQLIIGMYMSGAYQWFAKCEPTHNNYIYDIVAYTGSISGQTVGQIVFNDYAAILTNTYSGSGNKLSIRYASHKSFQPIIESYHAGVLSTLTDGEAFSPDVPIYKAMKSLFDGKLIIGDTSFSIVGKGIKYNGAVAARIPASEFVGRRLQLTFGEIISAGDTATSSVSIRFYNGSTYVSESSLAGVGETVIVDVPESGIDNMILYCYASVTSYSTSGETYNFKGIVCNVLSDDSFADLPDFHIARKIYCVTGDKNLLFTRGIVHAVDPYLWENKYVCSATPEQVHPFPRYLQILFSAPTTKDITLQLISNKFNRSKIQTGQIVVKSPQSPENNINVLCFGSSTTTDGVWAGELKRRLCGNGGTPAGDNLSNITFVGRADGTNDSTVKVEGISGWSWKRYIEGVAAKKFMVAPGSGISLYSRYTYTDVDGGTAQIWVLDYDSVTGEVIAEFYNSASSKNPTTTGNLVKVSDSSTVAYTSWSALSSWTPFTDNGSFGFNTYATKYCNGSIDVIICNLSYLNQNIGEDNDMTAVMGDVKTFVDRIHADFPSCKVLITTCVGSSPFGGAGYNYGASASYTDYGLLFGEWNFQEELEEFVAGSGYSSFCFVVNSLQEVDMENAFPTATVPQNLRTSGTEVVQTNALHPTTAGSYMTADSVYRCFVCTCLN